MTKKLVLTAGIVMFLIATNIASVAYYRHKITDMRQQSSFVHFSDTSFRTAQACLNKSGIENRIKDGRLQIREVDTFKAVGRCS